MKIAPSHKNEGAILNLVIAKMGAKISVSGQTCGQNEFLRNICPN